MRVHIVTDVSTYACGECCRAPAYIMRAHQTCKQEWIAVVLAPCVRYSSVHAWFSRTAGWLLQPVERGLRWNGTTWHTWHRSTPSLSIALSPHHYLLFTKPAVIHLHNTRLPSGGGALPVMRRYWWDGFCWSSNAQQAPFTVDSTHTYTRALLSRLHLTALAIHAACQWMPTHA